MTQSRKRNGFSLIELLIVVAVILIIASIAIPNLLRSKMSANEASAVSVVRNTHNSQAVYVLQYPALGYATSLAQLGPGTPCDPTHACLTDMLVGCVTEPCVKGGYLFYLKSSAAAAPAGTAARSEHHLSEVPGERAAPALRLGPSPGRRSGALSDRPTHPGAAHRPGGAHLALVSAESGPGDPERRGDGAAARGGDWLTCGGLATS